VPEIHPIARVKPSKPYSDFPLAEQTVLDVVREGPGTIDLEVRTDDGQCFMLPWPGEQFGREPVQNFWSQDVFLTPTGLRPTDVEAASLVGGAAGIGPAARVRHLALQVWLALRSWAFWQLLREAGRGRFARNRNPRKQDSRPPA
jgi:hypothetical protein